MTNRRWKNVSSIDIMAEAVKKRLDEIDQLWKTVQEFNKMLPKNEVTIEVSVLK